MKYFKFSIPQSNIVIAKNNFFSKVLDSAFLLFPKANPKFDKLIQFVHVWYIEYDDKNFVNREIGLNIDNKVILKMPFEREYGYWIDADMEFDDFKNKFDIEVVDETEFFKKWNEL